VNANFRGPTIELPTHLKRQLAAGHPWIYRDHVPRAFSAPSGTWVRVRAGGYSGFALWDAESNIALRIFSERCVPDAAWVEERVREAWQLRTRFLPAKTNAFRLLFGEGDGMPGLTVDVYGAFAVILTYASALDVLVPHVVQALSRLEHFHGIVKRTRDKEDAAKIEVLQGRPPPRDLIVEERGIRLYADLCSGQKSGLFLDHRENRAFMGSLAREQSVLNLFSYTGAFSLYAALGGAKRVTSVDISAPAAEAAKQNFRLNGIDPDAHEFIVSDVFPYLDAQRNAKRRYDIVICDPPSFANSREQVTRALRAYVGVNSAALRVTEHGGLYAAASCTAQVSPEAFRGVLAESAHNAKSRYQIIHDMGHTVDHPISVAHAEGRYLKFVLGRVLNVV
jgi:23S rRNA (cytosine1962-C5)-methyltransferase